MAKIVVSLLEFAKTGKFGSLHLGMSRQEVQDILGEPPQWSSDGRSPASATIWRYEDIELYFYVSGWDGKLAMIFTDHSNLGDGGEWIAINSWIVRRNLPRQELELALQIEKVDYSLTQAYWDSKTMVVSTDAGVRFSFIEECDPDWEEDLGLYAWHQKSD